MSYRFRLAGTSSPEIELVRPFWFGKTRVLVDGVETERLPEKGKPYAIHLPGGTTQRLFVKGNSFDYVPKVVVEGNEIALARKLEWYEYVAGGLPLVLFFVGGGLGALFGIIAAFANFNMLRADRSTVAKAVSIVGVTLVAFIAYLVAAMVLVVAIGR